MSSLRVSSLRGETNGSSPIFPDGVVVSGVTTSTTFSGNITGDVTGNITGTTGSFSGNVSVGGTLTYDDVTNIDSVGVITARSGIKVGAGQSISAVSGTLTYYGDGSQLTGVTAGGESDFVASGAIPNGQTVILKTDGTVTGVATAGAGTTFTPSPTNYSRTETCELHIATYDSAQDKVVIIYKGQDGNYSQAVVGTVSGTSITFGAPVTANNARPSYHDVCYDVNSGKIVYVFRDDGDSDKGKAMIGTVSGGNPSAFPNNGRYWSNATQTNFLTSTFSNAFDGQSSTYAETTSASAIGSITFDPPLPRSSITSFNVNAQSNGGNSQDWGFNGGTLTSRVCNGSTSILDLLPSSGDISSMEIRLTGSSGVAVVNQIIVNGDVLIDGNGGPTISWGSEYEFESSSCSWPEVAYDANAQKVVVVWGDSNYIGRCKVGTVAGNAISFGNETTFANTATRGKDIVYHEAAQKVVVLYKDNSDSGKGKGVVGTVSGTQCTFGSPTDFDPGIINSTFIESSYDPVNEKVVVVYQDESNSNYGTANVGTVSGTSITFGSPQEFAAGNSQHFAVVYDVNAAKTIIVYNLSSDGKIRESTINGTTIVFEPEVTWTPVAQEYPGAAYNTTQGATVIGFKNPSNSGKGDAVVYRAEQITTNLTTENYIGIAAEAISDGQTGKVNIIGGVNSGQTGLTTAKTYYVQRNGTLGTSAGNPSVVAGTSISSTKILVR